MKAVVMNAYGGPEVLELKDVRRPRIADSDVLIKAYIQSALHKQQASPFLSVPNVGELEYLKQLIEAGELIPVVDRTYPLDEVAEAMRYLEQEHARGKVVVTLS